MAEEQPALSREQVRQMIADARERVEARRQELARENTHPLERLHIREHTRELELEY